MNITIQDQTIPIDKLLILLDRHLNCCDGCWINRLNGETYRGHHPKCPFMKELREFKVECEIENHNWEADLSSGTGG